MVRRHGQISSRLLTRSTFKNADDAFSIETGKIAIIKTTWIYSGISKFITGSILLMKSEFQEVSVCQDVRGFCQ